MLRVMLVDNSPERADALTEGLHRIGCEVVASAHSTEDLYASVRELKPDVIIIDTESPDRDTLEHLVAVSRDQPSPILMFSEDSDSDTIRGAIEAGVSAYMVDGIQIDRLKPILDVAIAQFQSHQKLKQALAHANELLDERKEIEKAKGILMRQRGLSEEDAYQTLRKNAMNRNLRLVDVARQVISVSQILL